MNPGFHCTGQMADSVYGVVLVSGLLMSTLWIEWPMVAGGLWYGQMYVMDNEHRCILLMAFWMHRAAARWLRPYSGLTGQVPLRTGLAMIDPKTLRARAQRHIQRLCLGNRRISAASIAAEVEGVGGGVILSVLRPCTAHWIKLVCMAVVPEESLF